MSNVKPNQRFLRGVRHGPEIPDDWENEGGSLSQRPVEEPVRTDPGGGHPDSAFALLDALPLGILITDHDGQITYSNPASHELYAASESSLRGTHWRQAIDARDQSAVPARGRQRNSEVRPVMFEVRIIARSGRRIWTRHSIEPLRLEQVPGGYIHTIEDISRIRAAEQARAATEEELSTERERARVTLECIGDAVISTDAKGQVSYLNPVAERLTGWSREKAEGQSLSRVFKVVDTDSGKPIHSPAELAMKGLEIVQMPANCLLIRPDGSELAIEDSAAPILDKAGRLTGAVVIFRDRRLSRENTARMAYLARHDALTGLLNRVAFAEHFDQALKLARRHRKRIGLLFIDVDQFKQINDKLGHKAGDRLLRDISRKLLASVRSTDLVCRHGGDEFVVLLGEISEAEDASRVAEKIYAATSKPCQIQGMQITLELSIGISLYPDDGADMETLMHRADVAMYRAKFDSAKHHYIYQSSMEKPVVEVSSRKSAPM